MSKLESYRTRNGLTYQELAERVGLTAEAVRLHALGLRTPRRAALLRYVEITGGEIGPADFFEPQP